MSGDLPPIKIRELAEALLDHIDTLVPDWLRGGTRRGHEWVCGSLTGEPGGSFSVCLSGAKAGQWADFNTDDKGGDLVSLYAAIHNINNAEAAVRLAREMHLESVAGLVKTASGAPVAPVDNPRNPPVKKPKPVPEGWATVTPVPDWAPEPTFAHYHRQPDDIANIAAYRDGDALLGHVVRFRTSDGGKDDLPHTFTRSARDGGTKWNWRQWDEPRPLYLADGQRPNGRTVVLVEGEIKAVLLQKTLDAHCPNIYAVVSWAGGCKAWSKADWSWISDATVLLWPDADSQREKPPRAELAACTTDAEREALKEAQPFLKPDAQPGRKAMLGIGARLRDQGCDVKLLPIPFPGSKPSGYDCKDYIEKERWTGEYIAETFFAKAYTPGWDKDAATAEKRDGPVGAGGADNAGGGGGGSSDLPPDEYASDSDDEFGDYLDFLCKQFKCKRWDIQPNRAMVIKALRVSPHLRDLLGHDQMSFQFVTRKNWPWRVVAGPLEDTDDLRLGDYLSSEYKIKACSRAALTEAMHTVADERSFHPVRDWIESHKWDGKPRLENWLMHVMNQNPKDLAPGLVKYYRLVSKFVVMGHVARIYKPGCKFDYSVVLEGPQGRGKSTLIKTLVGADYFSDTKINVSAGKDALEQLRGIMAYEMAELASLRKADSEEIKQFFSSSEDRYRSAYGRYVQKYPRQLVIWCTTNKRQYLYDQTGNRRFWPVWVGSALLNLAWLEKYRGQLFAEALHLFQAGERYWPTEEEENLYIKPEQEKRMVQTGVQGTLYTLLTREGAHSTEGSSTGELSVLTNFVTIEMLLRALGVDVGKSTPILEGQIRDWLVEHGWEYTRESKGLRRRGYKQPAVWPPKEIDAEGDVPDMDAEPTDEQAQLAHVAGTFGDGDSDPF
jgi:putative DNA primase/helicase